VKILSPGVEHTQEADLRAEMLRIGSDFLQGCGAGAEQEIVDDLLVLQGQPRQLVGDCKDDMHIVDRQQFLAAPGEPLVASVGLALWTVSGTAGVERDGLVAALAAAVQMAAEGGRAAILDGGKHAEVQPGQPGPALLHEAVAMRTDDIGHLERWPFHLLYSLRDRFTWSRLDSCALSSGVPAARRWRSER
jgi:hypothetical protein